MNEKKNSQIESLNGLKGILSCIIAFCWHYQHFNVTTKPLYNLLALFYDYGFLAVEIFFMISGFGMYNGYYDGVVGGDVDGYMYLSRRIKRLYPPIITSTIVTAILQLIYYEKNGITMCYSTKWFTIDHFVLALVGLQNGIIGTEDSFNGPLWFVTILLIVNCVFFIVVRINADREDIIPFVFLVLSLIGLAIHYSGMSLPGFNSRVGRGMACFFIGTILGMMHKRMIKSEAKCLAMAGMLFFLFNCVLVLWKGVEVIGDVRLYVIIFLGPNIIWGGIYIQTLNNVLNKIRFLGKLSLAIFVWHFPVQVLLCIFVEFKLIVLDFSTRFAWGVYIATTLIVAVGYERLRKKLSQICIDRKNVCVGHTIH